MEYVKICGLNQYNHVLLCIENGADAVGFVYNVPESPRNLERKVIKTLIKQIQKRITTVIVFKPSSVSEVVKVINDIDASYFQIHPNFDVVELEKLSKEYKNKLILALEVNQANKSSTIDLIKNFCHQFFGFLLDNSEGHGNELDFKLVKEILKESSNRRMIVAGGIGMENIEEIMHVLKPYGIDVSSSLESEKGIKDPKRIKTFLTKINELKKNCE